MIFAQKYYLNNAVWVKTKLNNDIINNSIKKFLFASVQVPKNLKNLLNYIFLNKNLLNFMTLNM